MRVDDGRVQGFTLSELLLVAGVLGILTAIALPNYRAHSTRAKEARVWANAHTLQQVVEDWAVCNNGAYPRHADLSGDQFPGGEFPENPFTEKRCKIGAPGFSAGDLGYQAAAGDYRVEGYGRTALVITLSSRGGHRAGPVDGSAHGGGNAPK